MTNNSKLFKKAHEIIRSIKIGGSLIFEDNSHYQWETCCNGGNYSVSYTYNRIKTTKSEKWTMDYETTCEMVENEYGTDRSDDSYIFWKLVNWLDKSKHYHNPETPDILVVIPYPGSPNTKYYYLEPED